MSETTQEWASYYARHCGQYCAYYWETEPGNPDTRQHRDFATMREACAFASTLSLEVVVAVAPIHACAWHPLNKNKS